ncbi:MAG: hypothetical protein ACLF0P_05460 [Thermoanaerobaculia bacterium]
MTDEFEYRFQILLKEYELLQQNIRAHDTVVFQIKGWAITLYSASVVLSVNQKARIYLALSVVVILLFWGLEALFKSFQRHFILRNRAIEHFLRSGRFGKAVAQRSFGDFVVPDITAYKSIPEIRRRTSKWRVAVYRHTILPYLAMGLITLGLAAWPGIWGS